MPVHFDAETVQTFYVGPASCGVPGTAAGLELALERFGSVPLEELARPGAAPRPRGRPGQRRAGLHPRHPRPDPRAAGGDARALRAGGAHAARGRGAPLPGAGRGAGALRRRGGGAVLPRRCGGGAERVRRARAAARSGPADLAAYEAIERRPIRAPFRGAEVLTNPPPSSGGILIAFCLGLLERLGRAQRPRAAGRRDGRRQRPPRRGVRRGPLRRGPGVELPRPGRPRSRRGRPARLDHPHLGSRRRAGCARASPARTARAPACSSPAPA